jgi:hypothetical protein
VIDLKPKRPHARKTTLTNQQAWMLKHILLGWQFKVFYGRDAIGTGLDNTWRCLRRHKLAGFKGRGWRQVVFKKGMLLLKEHK